MNRPQSFRPNAANAVVELDCPWCAEPILATTEELEDGLACSACHVLMDLGQAAGQHARLIASIAA
jgi:hypothetical protein